MKAPFPWYGGKSRVSRIVWQHFGNVKNYVEPFFGSGAVLLNRPHAPQLETINDKDAYLANFWRALKAAPDDVAHYCDWPVNEADLHARHEWLLNQSDFRARMEHEPDYYDAKIAGWWVWGLCQWIGSGWCGEGYYAKPDNASQQLPHLGDGKGVHRPSQQRPQLSQLFSEDTGIRSKGVSDDLYAYMNALAERLRRVRVCCGDWARITGPSVTWKHGITGVFLDPPYSHELRDTSLYGVESGSVAAEVRQWAIENGDNPLLRIALCGYDGEHTMPESWECVAWKASGGYANQSGGANKNAAKERIWFSPHCVTHQEQMFAVTIPLPHRAISSRPMAQNTPLGGGTDGTDG